MKLVSNKPSVKSLLIEITDDFNENIETISELIVIALEESSRVPQLSADDFLVRTRMKCREILEFI